LPDEVAERTIISTLIDRGDKKVARCIEREFERSFLDSSLSRQPT